MNQKNKITRTPSAKKAKELAVYLLQEDPDYLYIREVFKHLRNELDIAVCLVPKKSPYIPSDREIEKFYEEVWKSRNIQNIVIIKTILYTGIRVGELVEIKLDDVALEKCQIHVRDENKSHKDRFVPFPQFFKETLAIHINNANKKGAEYLFESSLERKYTDRGIRKILMKYTKAAGMSRSISPHILRNYLIAWMKEHGIENELLQLSSGHLRAEALNVFIRNEPQTSIEEAQDKYNKIIKDFPV